MSTDPTSLSRPAQGDAASLGPAAWAARPIALSRRRLVRLRITTEYCPQVVLRVLDQLAHHAIVPWVIDYQRRARSLLLEIEIEDLPAHLVDTLSSRIEALVMVRTVRLLDVPVARSKR